MNVCILGGNGFIGSQLCELLLETTQHKVFCVDSCIYNNFRPSAFYSEFYPYKYKFVQEDIRNVDSYCKYLYGCDVLICLAAIVGQPACELKRKDAIEVNYEAIEKIMNYMTVQKVLYCNTNSGYGATDGTSLCDENSLMKPISLYAETKCEAEKRILAYPNSVSLRLATVFGLSKRPRFDLLVQDFVYKISKYKQINIFEPHFMRNFVGIKDVTNALKYFSCTNLTGVYNVGNPYCNMSKKDLATRIFNHMNIDENITLGEGRDVDQRNYIVSNKKLLKTGFEFHHGLEDGIREIRNFLWQNDFNIKGMSNV